MIRRLSLSIALVAGLGLSACTTSTAPNGRISIVASTNVWGQIASEIGGDKVSVTSFISNPNADPHSYEADAQNQLALANATVVIENGGGYDDFMDQMLSASGSKATVINAVQVASLAMSQPLLGAGSGTTIQPVEVTNEHVWYSLSTVMGMAAKIEAALMAADPANAATYRANQAAFEKQIQDLGAINANFRRTHPVPPPVGITEPVPVYLLNDMGIHVATPFAFSKAIEEGNGVPVAVMQQTEQQISSHQIKALVYNAQTTGAETTTVLGVASASAVPTVPVTETIPTGMTYVSWMRSEINAIIKAVR